MGSLKALLLGADAKGKLGKADEEDDSEEMADEEAEPGSDEEHGQALLDAIASKDAAAVGKAMKACAMASYSDGDDEEEA